MNLVVVLLSTLVNALILGWVARRVLGAPVGWPRTIVLSVAVGLLAEPLLTFVGELFGLPTSVADANRLVGAERTGYLLVLLLFLAWLVATEVAVLTLLEVFVPTGAMPSPGRWLRGLPQRVRRNRRYASIFRIAAKHGLAPFLRGRSGRVDGAVPARLAAALIDGGVTFVKLGQTLATRADLLPPAYIAQLSKLHSEVPAEPWPVVRAQLEAELGRSIDEVFSWVDQQPLAAASVAQVHRARLHDGTAVVLKVQRTTARAQATADLDIVTRLGRFVQRKTLWGKRIGAADLCDGFAAALLEELDYRIEVANMKAIAKASSGKVRVPQVWPDLSTARLIVMEEVPGSPLSRIDAELADLPAATRVALAGELFDSVLGQVVSSGVFHADLHPGNIVLQKGSESEPARLTLLDFGSVGRLDSSSRDALGVFLLAFERQDGIVATDALLELLGQPESGDPAALERKVGELLLTGGDSAEVFAALLDIVVRHGFSIPPMVAAAFRAIATLEGSLRRLDPTFDLMAAARSRASGLAGGHLSPGGVRSRLEMQLAATLPMLQRLPRRLDRITGALESGEFAAQLRPLGGEADRRVVRELFHQAGTTIVAATLSLCGVALIIADGGPRLVGAVGVHAWLGGTLLLFGFVLGARMLVRGFRSQE